MLRTGLGFGQTNSPPHHHHYRSASSRWQTIWRRDKRTLRNVRLWTEGREMTSRTASVGRFVCDPCFCLIYFFYNLNLDLRFDSFLSRLLHILGNAKILRWDIQLCTFCSGWMRPAIQKKNVKKEKKWTEKWLEAPYKRTGSTARRLRGWDLAQLFENFHNVLDIYYHWPKWWFQKV